MSLPIRLVLMRPRNAENLGAAARAMKNCGLAEWTWVHPEAEDMAPARRLAVHAEDALEASGRAGSLAAAGGGGGGGGGGGVRGGGGHRLGQGGGQAPSAAPGRGGGIGAARGPGPGGAR